MASGYDKFFRDARQAAGRSRPNTTTTARPRSARAATPEERIREELANRMRAKKKKILKKRQSLPVYPLVYLALTTGACFFAYQKSDVIDHWLEKIEISVFAGAEAKDAAAPTKEQQEKSAAPAAEKKEKAAEADVAAKKSEALNVRQWSEEELSIFSRLNERKQELDAREAELNKLDEELQRRKVELDQKIKQLELMRADISKTLKTRVANDQAKVDKLVQVYSGMKAQQAAKVIESLNEDLAVEILDKMKKKNAAEILDMMNAKKARRLSELLTGYERTISQGDSTSSDSALGADREEKGQDAEANADGEQRSPSSNKDDGSATLKQ